MFRNLTLMSPEQKLEYLGFGRRRRFAGRSSSQYLLLVGESCETPEDDGWSTSPSEGDVISAGALGGRTDCWSPTVMGSISPSEEMRLGDNEAQGQVESENWEEDSETGSAGSENRQHHFEPPLEVILRPITIFY
jgi:hypothetical protein